jgi:hypothetical protein
MPQIKRKLDGNNTWLSVSETTLQAAAEIRARESVCADPAVRLSRLATLTLRMTLQRFSIRRRAEFAIDKRTLKQ